MSATRSHVVCRARCARARVRCVVYAACSVSASANRKRCCAALLICVSHLNVCDVYMFSCVCVYIVCFCVVPGVPEHVRRVELCEHWANFVGPLFTICFLSLSLFLFRLRLYPCVHKRTPNVNVFCARYALCLGFGVRIEVPHWCADSIEINVWQVYVCMDFSWFHAGISVWYMCLHMCICKCIWKQETTTRQRHRSVQLRWRILESTTRWVLFFKTHRSVQGAAIYER